MYNTNAEYKTAVQSLPQNFGMKIIAEFSGTLSSNFNSESSEDIYTEDNIVVESENSQSGVSIMPEDIFEADFDESAFGTGGFKIGSAAATMFSVRIRKDEKFNKNELSSATLMPRISLYDSEGNVIDYVNIGKFFTRNIIVSGTDLKLDCSDRMDDASDIPYTPLKMPCSLYEICTNIANRLYSSFANTVDELPFLGTVIDDSIFEGYSLRQVISLIAEATGSFAIFNYDGELELKWFTESGIELREDWSKKAIVLNGNTFTTDGNPVKVTGVSVVSGEESKAFVGTEEYLLEIIDNPIAEAFPEETAATVYARVKDTLYIPSVWDRLGGDPSIQVGDIVTVIDNKEPYNPEHYDEYGKHKLYVSQKNWKYNGAFSETYEAQALPKQNKNNRMNVSKRLSRLAKQIVDTENSLTSEMDKRQEFLLLFNETIAASMGFYSTVIEDAGGASVQYMHDKPELSESKTIYTKGINGFAWTNDGWNNGNPVWKYGFDKNGNAILNQIYAYNLTADVIKSGLLKSKNGASWINMDDGTFLFRSAKADDFFPPSYTYEKALELDNKGILSVYGVLKSLIDPNISVAIGLSENGNYGAFTITDNASGYGDIISVYRVTRGSEKGVVITAPFLTNSEGTNRKGISILPDEIKLFNDGKNGTACSYVANGSAQLGVRSADVEMSNEQHDYMWINYFPPNFGIAPAYYIFGNGTSGGKAGIRCADIECNSGIECNVVKCNGDASFGGTIKNSGKTFVGEKLFVGSIDTGYKNCALSVIGGAVVDGIRVSSDRNLKENIVSVNDLNALEKLANLKFYSYDFKPESTKKKSRNLEIDEQETISPVHINLGLMADEAPEEIQSENGNSIDLYAYISFVAKSVQELTETVKEQQKYIEELKKRN